MDQSETTAPKPFVFVLMPFEHSFEDVYKLGIRPAAEEAGSYCERLDDQIFVESMLARIYNQIAKADLIVADMTGRNPNVFYEVGYAHALGKKVILLTQRAEDIPFDLRHYSHVIYGGSIASLRDDLVKRVAYLLRQREPDRRKAAAGWSDATFTLEGVPLTSGVHVTIQIPGNNPERDVKSSIGVFNPLSVPIDPPGAMYLALNLPSGLKSGSSADGLLMPDGRYRERLGFVSRILPQDWETRSFHVNGWEADSMAGNGRWASVELVVLTASGPTAIPFELTFRYPA